MRIFMTGATGVVGRRAVPLLVNEGHDVTAVGRTPEKRAALERAGAQAVTVDLFDPESVQGAVAGHDVVIHLATHIPASSMKMFMPGAWRENDRLRSVASSQLVDAALAGGAERYIQESFAPVYADGGDVWIDEEWPVQPVRYNRTVLDAERAAERFSEHGRVGVVLRYGLFYGPDSAMVRDMIGLVKKGWAPLPGSPDGFVSPVSHDDAASAVAAALRAEAGVYNVVDDEPVRRRAYVDALADALGVGPPKLPPGWFAHLAGSMGEVLSRSQRISNRKLRAETGWAPAYPSVREGWRAVIEALHGARLGR